MNAPDFAAREAERTLANGANGLQIYTNVNGAPLDEARFVPVFEVAANFNRPIMLHPVGFPNAPDYPTESRSKYEIWYILGWPYQTSVAMARLVFSGVMDRFPELKIVVHHLGAMIPYFAERTGTFGDIDVAARPTRNSAQLQSDLRKARLAISGAFMPIRLFAEHVRPQSVVWNSTVQITSYLHRTARLIRRMDRAGYATG